MAHRYDDTSHEHSIPFDHEGVTTRLNDLQPVADKIVVLACRSTPIHKTQFLKRFDQLFDQLTTMQQVALDLTTIRPLLFSAMAQASLNRYLTPFISSKLASEI
jgi:hypothetical protein